MTDQWLRVAEFPPHTDLTALCESLDRHAIEYRITGEDTARQLWVADAARVEEVMALLKDLFRVNTGPVRRPGGHESLADGLRRQFSQAPVMMVCLALSILGAAIVQWQFGWVHWLTFQDFDLAGPRQIRLGTLEMTLRNGEYWRIVTPIFVHFGIFHLAFNGLWLWEFGRRVEALAGSMHFLLLVLFAGAVSNWSQYIWSGPSLFGGMSGVLYALLGYIWIGNMVAPHPALAIPRGIIAFMLLWLVLCMTGAVGLVMQGDIANAAHVSGLVVGMILGAVFGLLRRQRHL